MLNKIIGYFDINSTISAVGPQATAKGNANTLHWIPQYLTLLVGIIVQPYLESYRNTNPHKWDFTGIQGHSLFAAVIAFVVFPQVYKRIVVSRNTPIIIVLAGIFSAALGWQSLFATAVAATK
jgi:hypothetical protein